MATDPDVLIASAIDRANSTASDAASAISAINVSFGTVGEPDGATLPLRQYPDYVRPSSDNTVTPVYEPPEAPLPSTPSLRSVGTVAMPVFPARPDEIVTSDLFNQVAPTSNIPDWNEAEPDLIVDDLIAEMSAIATPTIREFDFPALSALSIRDTPAIDIPAYDAPQAPDALIDPSNYANDFQASYERMSPDMQAFINDYVTNTLNTYCPGFVAARDTLEGKLQSGMTGTVLPDEIESAMFTRARGRVENEFTGVERGLIESYATRGFNAPPGAVMAGIHAGRLKGAEALANQATDIYIDRKKMEVQHLQFVMGLAATYVQSIFQLTVQYAEAGGRVIQYATAFAAEKTEKSIKVYEHLIERSKLAIAIMEQLGRQYEVKLKAALAGLDGYKLELEVEKSKKEVEIAQIKAIESQISAQEINVRLYTALIDAIQKKGGLEELKLKGYQIRSDVFKTRIQAQVAGFDVYKASLDGDKAKLEGRMTKLKLYETELQAIKTELEANIQAVQSTIEANKSDIAIYQADADVYKLSASVALQKFSQMAELKKLGQTIYATELQGSIDIFKAETAQIAAITESILREYEGRIKSFATSGELNLEYMKIHQQSAIAIGQLSASIAAAASGSVNAMASTAATA
jgi:hypothetical protein